MSGFSSTGFQQLPALPSSLLQQLTGTVLNSPSTSNSSSSSGLPGLPDLSSALSGANSALSSSQQNLLSSLLGSLTPSSDSLASQAASALGVNGSGTGIVAQAQNAITGFFKSGAFYALGIILIGIGLIALVLSNKTVQDTVKKVPIVPLE